MNKKKISQELVTSGSVALWSVVEPYSGVISSVCKDIFKSVSEARANSFFHNVEKVLRSNFTEKELEALANKIKTDSKLQEHLFDFIQTAVRTSSELAVCMLAIAYSKSLNDNQEKDSYLQACIALREISDGELAFFDQLTPELLEDFIKRNGHFANYKEQMGYYVVTTRTDDSIQKNKLTAFLSDFPREELLMNIESLKRRQMLIGCLVPSIDDTGIEAFGYGKYSEKYRDLMNQAKTLLSHAVV